MRNRDERTTRAKCRDWNQRKDRVRAATKRRRLRQEVIRLKRFNYPSS